LQYRHRVTHDEDMVQLTLPLPDLRQSYPDIPGPACCFCRQDIDYDQMLLSWLALRTWLLQHPEHAPPAAAGRLSLQEHPDLLWALEADARAHALTMSDRLAEIISDYFDGAFDDIARRGLKKPRRQP
jgi:hypothetical protein